jgi:hypothetical protein
MAHVISRRIHTWFETQGIARGICGEQSGIVMVIHRVLRFSSVTTIPPMFHSPVLYFPFIHSPIADAVQSYQLIVLLNIF